MSGGSDVWSVRDEAARQSASFPCSFYSEVRSRTAGHRQNACKILVTLHLKCRLFITDSEICYIIYTKALPEWPSPIAYLL